MAASIWRAFSPCRSAAIRTLESKINPMKEARVARDGSRSRPLHLWRTQHPLPQPSSQVEAPRILTTTGELGQERVLPLQASCHSRSRLPHRPGHAPTAQQNRWPPPLPRRGLHDQPCWRLYRHAVVSRCSKLSSYLLLHRKSCFKTAVHSPLELLAQRKRLALIGRADVQSVNLVRFGQEPHVGQPTDDLAVFD